MSLLHPSQIAQLYAAAAEEDGLKRMADAVRSILDVDSAGVWLIERGRITDISVTPDVAESLPDYMAYYQALDPWTGAKPKMVNRASAAWELFDEQKLVASEFYNDFARRFGILRPVGIVVDVAPGVLANVTTNRTGGSRLLCAEDKPLIEEVGAHLRGALRVFQRFRTREQGGAVNRNALDRLSFGALICDAEGRIRQLNAVALALSDARTGLRIGASRDGLSAEFPAETPRLLALVRAAALGGSGAMCLNGAGTARLSVLATPLPTDDLATLETGRALLCFSRLDGPSTVTAAALRQMFGLSPTQAELCLRLACGLTFDEAATERGIAMSTARTHFKAILVKTDTQNLRDLLRLLATIPQVIGGW